jgi:hypothetical protein
VPGQDRSYLARTSFDASTDVSQWTDRTIMRVAGERVQSAVIAHPDGEEFAISRDTPEQSDFTVAPIPAGRSLRSPGVANPISNALTNLTFDDVRPGTDPIDPTAAVSVVYQTFDGLVVALLIDDENGDRWATITVSAAEPDNPPDDFEEIRTRVAGRQFKLPGWAATNMARHLSDLLAPPAAAGNAPGLAPPGPVLDPGG